MENVHCKQGFPSAWLVLLARKCNSLQLTWLTLFLLTLIVLGTVPSCNTSSSHACPKSQMKHLTKMRGRIESPNYPQPYDKNVCMDWFIAPDPSDLLPSNTSQTITISFDGLEIPSKDGNKCKESYLLLGPVPEMRVCGNINLTHPIIYISQRDHVWLHFNASGILAGRGFSLTYTRGWVPSPKKCIEDEYQCSNGKCIYKKWQCNGANECGDGSDERPCPRGFHALTTLGPWQCSADTFGCFSKQSGQYECYNNVRQCDGHPDCEEDIDEKRCEDVCRHTQNGPRGVLSSPNFPRPYPNNANCDWVIHVNYSHVIQLRFTSFELEKRYHSDYIEVYDGMSRRSPLIGKYDGEKRPPALIESTGNRLYIVFYSNGDTTEKGFNATFQQKGSCFEHQMSCGYGELDCFTKHQHCDGIWHCRRYGGDERGCGTCPPDKFQCDPPHGIDCYSASDRCDGTVDCHQSKQDEKGCTSIQCGPHNGTFLCANSWCIHEAWHCDGTNDCNDHSDEISCSEPSVKVITAAVIGSLICGLLLVIALGCTCKLYALRLREQLGDPLLPSTPISRIQEQILARQLAPPPYNEAMVTSRSYDEFMESLRQNQNNSAQQQHNASTRRGRGRSQRSQRSGRGDRHGRSGTSSGGRGSEPSSRPAGQTEEGTAANNEDDVELIDVSMTSANHESDEALIGIDDNITSRDSDVDLESSCDPSETDICGVSISIAEGVTAHWHQGGKRRSNPIGSTSAQGEEETRSLSQESVILSLSEDGDNSNKIVTLEATPDCLATRAIGQTVLLVHDAEGSDGISMDSESVDLGGSIADNQSDNMPLL